MCKAMVANLARTNTDQASWVHSAQKAPSSIRWLAQFHHACASRPVFVPTGFEGEGCPPRHNLPEAVLTSSAGYTPIPTVGVNWIVRFPSAHGTRRWSGER